MDAGTQAWIRVVSIALLGVGMAGVFAVSAYFGGQLAQHRLDDLGTRQAEIESRVALLSTEVAVMSTEVAAVSTQAAATPPTEPSPTAMSKSQGTLVSKPTPIDVTCPEPTTGTIASAGQTVYLFEQPNLMSKHEKIMEGAKVMVCCMTETGWAKVHSQSRGGWVQIDYIDLGMGRSWTEVPPCQE